MWIDVFIYVCDIDPAAVHAGCRLVCLIRFMYVFIYIQIEIWINLFIYIGTIDPAAMSRP